MSRPEDDPLQLAHRAGEGDARALGRALTWIENRDPRLGEFLSALPAPRPAFRIGITGAAGVGKSSLIARLIPAFRSAGETVAVLAVDPSSPRTGGALLGDRVRMRGHEGDAGVFIRSFASRTGTGGLAGCTADAADLLSCAGFGVILLETLGVGQLDLEVVAEADHVVLLLSPEAGDTIQLLKGGLLEVVDRVVVSRSDRLGATEMYNLVVEAMEDRHALTPALVSAATGSGCDELASALIDTARATRAAPDPERVVRGLARRIVRGTEEAWLYSCWRRAGEKAAADELACSVQSGRMKLGAAIQMLAARGLGAGATRRQGSKE